jgi:hypothetical protein
MAQLASVTEDLFTASIDHDGAEVMVRLAGTADVMAKQHLERLLGEAHDTALRLGVDRVRVDLRDLVFMNSSCLKDMVGWLNKVRVTGGAGAYRVVLWSSANHHWQRRTLRSLVCFAPDAVTIEVA